MLKRQDSRGLPTRFSEQYSTDKRSISVAKNDDSGERQKQDQAISFWLSEAEKLQPERRALFLESAESDNYEDYVSSLARAVQDTVNNSKISKLSRRIKPIYLLANSIAPITTSASQINPMPASLVLGGITCILSLSVRLDDFQSKLIETLEWMGDEVDLINLYRQEGLFGDDPAIKACEINIAADILKFCRKVAKLFYDEDGKKRNTAVFALRTQYKDFDVRFGEVKTNFKLHLDALEKRRDMANIRKMRSVHDKVHDISEMLKHEYGGSRKGTDGESERDKQKIYQEERRRRFLDWLPSLNFGEIQESNFDRLVPGSGDWLLDHHKFQTWRDSANSDLLWVYGKPGAGKSHLAARVITELGPSLSSSSSPAMAYAYCTTTQMKARMTMNNLLGSLLGQLYKQLPLSEGIDTLLSRADTSSKEELQRSEMKEGIKKVVSRLRSSFIIVDGLDECNHFPDRQFEDLCSFLAGLTEPKDSGSSTKILIFSRPDYKAINSAFSKYPQVEVDGGVNDADIKAYISQKVDEINGDPSPEERLGFEEIKSLMFNNAGGLFLWVHFKAKYFKEIGSVEDIKDALQDTTEDLDDLYGEEIKKILNHSSRFVRDRALRALLWVTNSYRPLTKIELLEALSIKPGRRGLNQCQRLPRDISLSTECADLISEVNGRYQLRHASLKDFLSSQLPTLLAFGALQLEAHTILAETCLTYINLQQFDTVQLTTPKVSDELCFQYPLLDYASLCWGDHFVKGNGHKNKRLETLLEELLSKENAMRLTVQIKVNDFKRWTPGKTTPLHILAIFNLVEVARTMPKLQSLISNQDEFRRSPIEYSVKFGRREMTRWLLDRHLEESKNGKPLSPAIFKSCERWLLHDVAEEDWEDIARDLVSLGFDKDIPDFRGETPIHSAAKAGANRTLSCFLEMGALLNTTTMDGDTPLTAAAFHLNPSGVDALLRAGVEATQAGKYQETALHYAAECGLADMVVNLLSHGADVNARCSPKRGLFGQTPLHYAARCNMAEVVEILIKHEAGMDIETTKGDNAFMMACGFGNIEVVKVLLKNGTDPSTRNSANGQTGLHVAADRGDTSLIKILLETRARDTLLNALDEDGNTPLIISLMAEQTTVAKMLLEQGAQSDLANKVGCTPLWIAIENNCGEVARLLLTDYKSGADRPGYGGKTALHLIASRGWSDLLPLILEQNGSPEARDDEGLAPLHYAAAFNQCDFINELMRLSSGLDTCPLNIKGLTPLHFAAREGSVDAIRLLKKINPSSCSVKTESAKMLPIHHAAFSGQVQCVAELVTPETINSECSSGETPLWIACMKGRYNVVRHLIECGADVDKADESGNTPALVASSQSYIRITNLLLDNGASAEIAARNGTNLLHIAAEIGNEKLVDHFLRLSDNDLKETNLGSMIFAMNEEGWDAMCFAARGGQHRMVERLRKLQIPIDSMGRGFMNPLTLAAAHGYSDFVKVAVAQGASLQSKSRWDEWFQRDALLNATACQRRQTAEILLANGADPTMRDCYGMCAIDYAAQSPLLSGVFDRLLKDYQPLDPKTRNENVIRGIVKFASAEELAQAGRDDKAARDRHLQVCGITAGLLLLNTPTSIEQARLCMFELAGDQVTCDMCAESVSVPFFQCTVCTDLDLCPPCHQVYCQSTPPNTIPEHIKDFWALEEEMYPVLRVAVVFRKQGVESLPICFKNLGQIVEEWIDERAEAYVRWEKFHELEADFNPRPAPGWTFIRLLDAVRGLKWLDPGKNNAENAERTIHFGDVQQGLETIYEKFSPQTENHKPACNGHEFIEILPHTQLSAEDQNHFEAEGNLKREFIEDLARQYSDRLAQNNDESSVQAADTPIPHITVQDQVIANEVEMIVLKSDRAEKNKQRLNLLREKLLENIAESSPQGNTYSGVNGAAAALDTPLNVHEISWELAHAILGVPYPGGLSDPSPT
ncbi:uncharacterized protein CTRU02_202468 [Colletotrichum truncatum]|uniref:Uncharacterized protein n=1 Tax=Colletotrichum truncatum TaxID=5467 RepID=A0ACC3ZKF2_COLTU|nr:uncharacterized protein CTRU02_01637 [Colletotrichum truncatum]KAF6799958.1 hypothetical protein CTRU02_01637 [Colletotrichum truncatum]